MNGNQGKNPFQYSASSGDQTSSTGRRLSAMELVVICLIVASLFILIMPSVGQKTSPVANSDPISSLVQILDKDWIQLGAKVVLVSMGVLFLAGVAKAVLIKCQ
jgi:hypothetical protein